MDAPLANRHLGTRGWLRLAVAAALVLVLILTLEASPAVGASRKACRVTNTDSGRSYTALQAAVDAAKPGARLVVKGTCLGETVIRKDLVIVGVETERLGKPTLSGAGKTRVLSVRARVKLRDLDIKRGWAFRQGAGIRNLGTLILADVTVHGCQADWLSGSGGGIYNVGRVVLNGRTRIAGNSASGAGGIHNEGALVLNGSSRVVGNGSNVNAGGIWNYPKATLTLNGSSLIRGNSSLEGIGGVANDGTLTMNDASAIRHNSIRWDEYGTVGGVDNDGTLTMNDASSIAGHRWGGVANSGRFTMSGTSSITGNTGPCYGGGVSNGGRLTMSGSSSISGNTVVYLDWKCGRGPAGAGVSNSGSLTLNDQSSIHHNVANVGWILHGYDPEIDDPGRGGGVYNWPGGTVTMAGSSRIHSNAADSVPSGPAGQGGGLYNASGSTLDGVFCGTQTGANVYGNTPDDCYFE